MTGKTVFASIAASMLSAASLGIYTRLPVKSSFKRSSTPRKCAAAIQ